MKGSGRAVRTAVFAALDTLGLPRLFMGKASRILLYHGVSDEHGEGIFNYRSKFVSTAAFGAHIAWLKNKFSILPLAALLERRQAGSLPPQALAITFDDGYANNYTDAYPILREASIPATFFIATNFVEKNEPLPVDIIEYAIGLTAREQITIPLGGARKTFRLKNRAERIETDLALRSHMKKIPADEAQLFIENIVQECGVDLRKNLGTTPYRPMTWEQMREMESHGMTFAPHTKSHPILSRISREQAREEITGSVDALKKNLKNPLFIFAYPNGTADDFNPDAIAILKEAGFTAALTTKASSLRPADKAFTLPRFTMDGANDMPRARLIVSSIYSKLAGF